MAVTSNAAEFAQPLVTDGEVIVLMLAVIVGTVYALSRTRAVGRLFEILPVPLWIFVVPMVLTTAGVLPESHGIYRSMGAVLMPASLFLLTITVNLPQLARMGWIAAVMVAAGALGTALGAVVSFSIFVPWLSPESWKGFSVLSAGWIGGSANAVAMQQSLQADPAVLAPMLATDTIVGYGWVTLLIVFAAYQQHLDRWLGAKPAYLETLAPGDVEADATEPIELGRLAIVIATGAAAAALALAAGRALPELGTPTIITHTAWSMLLAVTVGLGLSFTRVRNLDRYGANPVAYYFIFVLLASLGAQGNFSAFLEAPVYLAAGVCWLAVHVGVLLVVARLLRLPFFFVATGSTANIGGVVTCPLVAGIYRRQLVSLGLLMALAAQIGGVYIPVLVARVLATVQA